MTTTTFIILIGIGLLAGMLSGLIGIGGGIIMVPMLVLIGFSQHQAQGTSLAALLPPVTLLAVINYHQAGNINWKYAIVISVFFIVGSYFGSKVAININEKMLRKIFAVVLLLVAGKMFFGK
ncbi:sulfite exporter TauE/SafE family protein [Flavobacterium sp.]|uniref:sulfite exporter TauE/SafE family protein n=1 Tax=Flavobacterium sp. TaxID=239 RepID=UPI0039E6E474